MCKIAIFFDIEDALDNLDRLEQPHGGGLYSASKKVLIKHPDFDAPDFEPVLQRENLPVLIHTRYASSGEKGSLENTQPIRSGRLIFSHNGTISKDKLIPKISLSDPEVTQKLLDIQSRSDSSLLAESLMDASVEQVRVKLAPFISSNNFICYNELEEKFIVMGTFALRASKGQCQAVIVGPMPWSTEWTRVQGVMIIFKSGKIVFQSLNVYSPPAEKKRSEPWKKSNSSGGKDLKNYWTEKQQDKAVEDYHSTLIDAPPDPFNPQTAEEPDEFGEIDPIEASSNPFDELGEAVGYDQAAKLIDMSPIELEKLGMPPEILKLTLTCKQQLDAFQLQEGGLH